MAAVLNRKPTNEATPVTAAPEQIYVRLINGCSTYVTPEREVFYAKDSEGKPRVYPVAADALSRFLNYRDDYGRRFFKQMSGAVEGSTLSAPSTTAKVRDEDPGPRTGPVGTIDELADQDGDDGELDTGTMRLKDKDGNPVGVTV